jgi:hypothetical protein
MPASKLDALQRRNRTTPQSTGKKVTAQERDLIWFQKIQEHGPLSSSYLHAFTQHMRRSEKRAKERLTDLFNEDRTPHGGEYLDRPKQQFRVMDARYNELVHDLKPAAERALREAGMEIPAPRQHHGPWLHRFMTACITASIEIATLSRDDIHYIPGSAILARANTTLRYTTRIQDPKTEKWYDKDLIPDAIFGLEYRVRRKNFYRFFLVEADRGTEPTTSANFHRKSHERNLLQYRDYIGNGKYKDHLGLTSSLLVLNVLTDAKKMEKMLALTEEMSGRAGNSYMLFQMIDGFGQTLKPPKPMFGLLDEKWERAGASNFSILQK